MDIIVHCKVNWIPPYIYIHMHPNLKPNPYNLYWLLVRETWNDNQNVRKNILNLY
jgi:hypothetical protein